MRRGTLFNDNKEKVSVFIESSDNVFGSSTNEYVFQDKDAVFYPVSSTLRYNAGVLTQTQAEADWRVILAEPDDSIDDSGAYTLRRESDDTEYKVVDVLAFGGEMHLFVSEEGL